MSEWISKQNKPPKLWLAPSGVGIKIQNLLRFVGIYPHDNEVEWIEDDFQNFKPSKRFPTKMTKMQMFVEQWEKSQLLEGSDNKGFGEKSVDDLERDCSHRKNEELKKKTKISQVSMRIGPVIGTESVFFRGILLAVKTHFACK